MKYVIAVCPSICLSFVRLYVCLSICPSICLYVCLSHSTKIPEIQAGVDGFLVYDAKLVQSAQKVHEHLHELQVYIVKYIYKGNNQS